MKQQYLMLAHTYDPSKHDVGGWFVSEKLDGVRAYWDGGVSRGRLSPSVPYSNTVKNFRFKDIEIATGLWSRTGKVIHAPDYWLDTLPSISMDGELFGGRRGFQNTTSIVSTKNGSRDDDWSDIKFKVFDSPPFETMFRLREITVRDYSFWVYRGLLTNDVRCPRPHWNFETVQDWLKYQDLGGRAEVHHQIKLPEVDYEKRLARKLDVLLNSGGEGVMLRNPNSFWVTQRSRNLLKYKPWRDAEAVVTGFTSGRETDKGSRLLGMIGALVVDFNGKRLELSGLTDAEREFQSSSMEVHASENPGVDMPEHFQGKHFKRSDTITFKYRELSDDGVPKEARYWRKPQ